MKRVQVQLHVVASEQRCVVVDQRCRESEGKVKIEGYMSISDEEAHQREQWSDIRQYPQFQFVPFLEWGYWCLLFGIYG